MNPNDKKEFAEIMMGMADNFRDSITNPGMKIRFNVLKNFTIEQVKQAATKIMLTRKYTKMPPVAEFIEAIQGVAPKIEHVANVQAGIVIDVLRRYGAGTATGFKDPVTNALMKTRWPYRAWAETVTEKDLTWWIKDFVAAYESYQVVENHAQITMDGRIKELTDKIGEIK